MSFEERNTMVFLVTTPLVGLWMWSRISSGLSDGSFAGPDGLMLWARTVLWVIPVGIVVCIVGTILANILYAIVTNDGNPDMTEDERDKAIAIRGNRATMVVSALFWIIALIALARGATAIGGLNLILAGFVLGDFAGNVVKIVNYRMGL